MLQAALSDRQFLDLLPFSQNGFVAAKVDVSGCDVVQALVVALVIVVVDEGPDLSLEITGQVGSGPINRLSLSRCRDSRSPVIGGYDEQFVLAD